MARVILAFCLIVSLVVCVECFGQSIEETRSVSSTQPASHAIPLQERQALVTLYQSTDGGHWKNHDGWLGPVGTECTWHGVECIPDSDGFQTVIGIELDENNLVGSMPTNIGQLAHLRWLNISRNQLKGSLPDAVGELTQLEDFMVFGNQLSGGIPDPLIHRWLSGSLWIHAEASLLTDVSEIDFESNPSMLLCGRRRIVLRSDGDVMFSTVRCRNATPNDRRTFCEVKQGHINSGGFATLSWMLTKNGFYSLQAEYSRNISEGTFESTRVSRAGKAYEVVNYADGGPFELWTIERAIEGVALSTEWKKTRTEGKCSRWRDEKAPQYPQSGNSN